MTRNWYAIYTCPQREKKVAQILTEKGIRNYFPVNSIISKNGNKKESKEALISSCIFVWINEPEMGMVKDIPGIVNFLHWMAKPSIIKWEEIEAIRQVTSVYFNIKLEKSGVKMEDDVRIIDEPIFFFKENVASVKFHVLKIVLPSLGYTLIAEREKINEEVSRQVPEPQIHFPEKLISLFSN